MRDKFFEQKSKQKDAVENFKKPENEEQQIIFDSISESIGHQNFGIDTNIYEAGIDSLGCVMLLSNLYEKLGMSISLQELSEHPTIEQLEEFAKIKKEKMIDYSVRETYPLIGIQKYFGYILRGNTTGNLPFLFKLDKSVDLDRLKKSIEKLFDVHPELKNIIQTGSTGALENFRNDDREIDIPIITVSDEEWDELKGGLITPYMFGENDPIYHSAIYVTDSDNYLFFDLAHIAGDGVSMNIIFEDINAIYLGKEVKKQTYTMYEYILDEEERKTKGKREECIKYFSKQTENLRIRKSILNRCYSWRFNRS